MATALITLGRLPKALAIARALKLAGWQVLVAEPFKLHIARVSRSVDACLRVPAPNDDPTAYRAALLDIINTHRVELVVPVSEETHHVLPLRADLPDGVRLLGPDFADYQHLANKHSFQRRAADRGLTVPATAELASEQAKTLIASTAVVLKPAVGCSGIGVQYLKQGDSLPDATTADNTLVQRYVEGEPISTLSFVRDGQLLSTQVYRGRIFSGSVAVCFERFDPAARIKEWVATFLTDLHFTGFVAFDFIVDQSGVPWGLECNPRLTSGIHFMELSSVGALLTEPSAAAPSESAYPRWQWAYSTLTEAYGALFRGEFKRFADYRRLLFSSRDTVWLRSDPLPFLLMTPLSWPILWPAIRHGLSLGEACQRDIAPLWSAPPRVSVDGACSEA